MHHSAHHVVSAPIRAKLLTEMITGNLPYTATTAQIATHFAKVRPISIRHPTSKLNTVHDPGNPEGGGNERPASKGYAFLEFEAYDRMKTCLKLYHHSHFAEPGQPSPGAAGVKEIDATEGKPEEQERETNTDARAQQQSAPLGRKINVELT